MYSRLPPEPQRKEPQVEVFPDTQESYTKPGLANYLDEFLSAIKVFGYLERPVFHELTRTMQTRKLIAGETLLLEEEKGFCLVVDGLVQIFVKSTRGSGEDSDAESPDGEDPGEERRNSGNQGYQLLTEVKNGAPMSSLFSILSLFTEDVKLRHDEGEESETEGDFSSADMGRPLSPLGRNGYQTPGSGAASPFGMTSLSRPASSRRISDINGESFDMTQGSVPPLSLDGRENTASEHTAQGHGRAGTRKRSRKHVSAHPDIVARASVDTTIAIIPATAFHRLTRVYPKATAHIVQVILTRLQRVTLATGHSYLGLTGEVLQTERLMDKYTQYDLPDFLRGSAMERLKDKFRKEQERVGTEDRMKGIALHNPRLGKRRRSSSGLRKDAAIHARLLSGERRESGASSRNRGPATPGPPLTENPKEDRDKTPTRDDRGGISAGDLLTNTHMARHGGRHSRMSFSQPYQTPKPLYRDGQSPLAHRSFDPFAATIGRSGLHRQDSIDEDLLFREAILDCMFKAIGLHNVKDSLKKGDSIIASRMRALIEDPEKSIDTSRLATRNKVSSTENLRTVAVLPVTAGVPVVEFGNRLLNALNQIGTPKGVTSLNDAAILNHLGRHAFSKMGKLKLSQYLADLEEKYGLVLYVADTNVQSPWTQTCISQADCILLVGLAEGSPNIGEYERFLLTTKTTARKELVLLHAERYCPPGLTRRWLRNRMWINGSHHHIQMAFRSTAEPVHPQVRRFGTALKQRVQVLQAEIQKYTSRRVRQTPLYSAETPFKGDFHRLARRLCGKSVGLVLGGGGARGIAHVGIIRALEEAGIPIDIVGGTSIGSFIGALYAWDADVVPMYGRAKKFAGRMGSMWRFALDLTYPSWVYILLLRAKDFANSCRASYTTGHEFNRGIFKTFGDAQIEDFWLEYYCNTTNISKSRSEIHTSGYVWRYVRASMTLAGLLPPLCDEGNMLVDGGYVDNLTVSHMKSLGADVVFAVDVGAIDDDTPQQYGDSLSGFWASLNRWNPFSSFPNPPTLSEIQARLAYVSSVVELERAKTLPGCRYMRPPIETYGTLEFAKFDEIYEVGYKYGKQFLADLREKGVLPVMEETEEKKNLRRTMAPRRASI
ncbi:phosphatidylcholine and lysophosphatidylcholine phospholipase [Zalaria obscura]|uniref:Phosphatidylcholine and lysophosphatidylcholine phospholipase n=1 Tax=Zalaria obscura TaxID=2024903 RepID=A0ACC3S2Q1_9PEZI